MAVLICILTHNNLALSRAAITSALLQDYEDKQKPAQGCSLLILDNASTDSTPQWLSSAHSTGPAGFSYIAFAERQSVAYCWNWVLEWAFSPLNSNHYEAVLLANNDVILREDYVTWLMRDGGPFVTGISVRSESELAFPSPPTTRRPHPDFSAFLIRPECWKKVGRFDEGFSIAFFEDNDYHVRAHYAKVPLIGIDLPFVHVGSATVKQADKAEQRMIQRAADRNRARFEDMYGCVPGSKAYEMIFSS